MFLRPCMLSGLLLAAVSFVTGLGSAAAQENLTKIIVPYAAGGAADSTARIYAEKLRQTGLSDVLVDNRPGASARLGVDVVRKSKPDGLTLLLAPSPLLTIYPWTYKNLGYDPDADLVPVAMLVEIPTAVVAGVDQPYATMPSFVEWMRKNPTKANLGVAALGSSGHLGADALGREVGVVIQPVPYKGASPMLVDVVSGQVAIGWDAAASMMALYKGGKIRFLGVSGSRRMAALPDVPTLKEQGYGQFEHATSFYGIFAPAGTPVDKVLALQKSFQAASEDADLKARLGGSGLVVTPLSGSQMAERVKKERAFWGPIVKASGVVAD